MTPWLPPAAVVAAIVAYAALATTTDPFTWPMRVAVAAPSAAVVVLAVRRGWLGGLLRTDEVADAAGRCSRRGLWASLAVWVALLGVLGVFQVALFMSNPRSTYPTLSSLANATFEAHWLRAAAFALWVWVGWYLVERRVPPAGSGHGGAGRGAGVPGER